MNKTTTSLAVAEYFGVEHGVVLVLIGKLARSQHELFMQNFSLHVVEHGGKSKSCYVIAKHGLDYLETCFPAKPIHYRRLMMNNEAVETEDTRNTLRPGSDLMAFAFDSHAVRVIRDEKDEPWFITADLLSILNLDRKALERLDEDEKGVSLIHTLGGFQDMGIVNESGLYNLVLGSRKPEAKRFKRWITHDVLPSIRKTGKYAIPNVTPTSTIGHPVRPRLHLSIEFPKGAKIGGFSVEEINQEDTSRFHVTLNSYKGTTMQENKIIRAIDLGYGRVKLTAGKLDNGNNRCSAFPSIVGRAGGKNLGGGFFNERKTMVVRFNDLNYEVGEDAIMATSGHSTRILDMRYVFSDNYQVLMRGALKAMGDNHIDVLVLGAPVSNFMETRDYLRSSFKGIIDLDGTRSVNIDKVIVLPQPLGGYAWFGKQHNIYARISKQLNLIVDPGYFTLDWMVSKGVNFSSERSGSHPGGISSIIRSVAREISQAEHTGNMDSLFTWDAIDQYFYANEPFLLKGREYDLSKHMQAAKMLVDEAVDA
ncbi:MAG: hypothetical protein KGI54_18010, partial [Pseudomonadota bacterium]|nr:hypothetical protein [Pseudomonadota bacterium]